MTRHVNIKIEPSRELTPSTELELLRGAVAQNPASTQLRMRLARLLNSLDMFSDSIKMLTAHAPLGDDYGVQTALIAAYFARNEAGDTLMALQVAERALSLELNETQKSYLLAELAKAHLRRNDTEKALSFLRKALELDISNVAAFKRLAMELFRQNKPLQVIKLTDDLKQNGIGHSRLLAARTMAFAASGDYKSAQQLACYASFIYEGLIETPAGWSDLATFNAALVSEINTNSSIRFERYGTASEKTWRVEHPATGTTPAVRALLAEIASLAERHAGTCAKHDHFWTDVRPQSAILRSWCVITEGHGYEQWHMHPQGWMSGGYYVEVPDAVTNGDGEAGCLAFGLPSGLIGEVAAHNFGQTLVRPKPGLLTLFPSHVYHRTFPHNAEGRRMCIAFDICPA